MKLKDKKIIVGITGGIAAYKACDVISKLRKLGAEIEVIMTENAEEFITPLTVQTVSNNMVYTEMFEMARTWEVEHIELAKRADLFLILPATANFIGKIANGIADDMLTTTVMATKADVLIAPAMNTNMYDNEIVQENIEKLRSRGYKFISPQSGILACGDEGIGKLASVETIVSRVEQHFEHDENGRKGDLEGMKIIVTAGPTVEAIDPVRYITNKSTGKMGYSIAKQAVLRGADVTLITGETHITLPEGLSKVVKIKSACDLHEAMIKNLDENQVVIQSAAVADYRPRDYHEHKIKKSDDDLTIVLERNKDVAHEIGKVKGDRILVGFAAETDDVDAKRKIEKKNLDFIVLNDLTKQGAGFGVETNIVKIIDRSGEMQEYPKLSKTEVGDIILDKVLAMAEKR